MWIAVDGKQIVGFACYDCTMRGFFGPIGVDESYRGQGVGRALLLHCLNSMREMGYGYAVIGSVSPNRYNFYHNACGAQEIVDSGLSIYKDLL
jgi:predicted N-acetyltransferase YhbS